MFPQLVVGNTQRAHRMKSLVFLFPMIVLPAFIFAKIDSPGAYWLLLREDSVVEYTQAVSYFLAAMLSLLVSLGFHRSRMLAPAFLNGLLSFVLFFMSMEEISWGQRIIGFELPRYFAEHNVQDEITLHNLDVIHPRLHTIFSLLGIYGAFGCAFAYRFAPGLMSDRESLLRYAVPEWFAASYFFLSAFMYIVLSYIVPLDSTHAIGKFINTEFFFWRDLEVAELFLSLGFLVFALTNYVRYGVRHSLNVGKPISGS